LRFQVQKKALLDLGEELETPASNRKRGGLERKGEELIIRKKKTVMPNFRSDGYKELS